MNKLTFDYIRNNGLLLFEYVRGSNLYNLNTADSDIDYGGVFIAPTDTLLGLGLDYQDEVSDDKHDTTWWEIGKFMKLVLTSNPTVLEALFVPDDKVVYEHPMFAEIRSHRNEFLTKSCFMPFGGYAISQIKKAQGQNKKIHWDMEQMQRKTPIDFCFTYDGKQGSVNISYWLNEKGLRQDCCGLVNIPNMKGVYGLYYDFGQHIKLEDIKYENFKNELMFTYLHSLYPNLTIDELWNKFSSPIGGHCGIINNDLKSNSIRFCSTAKDELMLCQMSYNQDGYESHCRKYKEYEEWKNKRNKARYESNLKGELSGNPDMMYDCKNMMHCFRLLSMCIEIARGEGIKLDRTNIDKEFLMDIRLRKYGYSELMDKLIKLKDIMDYECNNSKIKENIDKEFVNNILINFRKNYK